MDNEEKAVAAASGNSEKFKYRYGKRSGNVKNSAQPITIGTFVFIGVIWAIMNIWAAVYMSSSSNIYFWDASTYWDLSRKIASGEIQAGFREVYNSIALLDYNYVAALPGALWCKVFGDSRTAYILGLVNLYFMPAVCMIYVLARKLSKGEKTALVMTLCIIPALIFMALIGFTDIGAMLPCFLAMYLYLTRDIRKAQPLRHIAIGALLVFVIIWRRYFAFFSVSFITAMLADAIIFRKNAVGAFITLITSGLILLLGFRDYLFGKLIADYGSLYSGYKFSASTDVKLVMRYFGMVNLLAFAAGSVAAWILKKETRTVFLWVQMIVCFVMFIATQTHGQQHLLLYIPSLMALFLILIKHIKDIKLLLLTMVLSVVSIVNVNIVREQPNSISEIKHYAAVPNFSMLSIVRNDTQEILDLRNRLDQTIEDGSTLGVLASSFKLNDEILMNVRPSLGLKNIRANYITALPQVDSRDKDMYALYNVNYILVAFPAQTHLAPENQKVVTEAVRSFEVFADFATAYDEVEGFETQINGMDIKLYKRNRTVNQSDMAVFEKRLGIQ